MTKQEEIRQEIESLSTMDSDTCEYERCKKYNDNCCKCRTDQILSCLHSQGVVIKVDRELPSIRQSPEKYEDDKVTLAIETQGAMLKAGYVAVEPLIEEKTNVRAKD